MSNDRRATTRGELLADLADAVNELCEPRTHSEMLEANVTATIVTRSGKVREKRTRERRRHTITLPGLIEALREAAVPGAADSGSATGGFESRPSAELEPLNVLREITDRTGFWARVFEIERETLEGNLHALVGAPHDMAQLADITRQAQRWVRRARLATGFDPAPFNMGGASCPYCDRRNSLVVTADLQTARCTRCGVDWTPDTIGLLADMLATNATVEVLALAACWMTECQRYGEHTDHQDARGRTWKDTCELSDPNGRISA